MRHVLLVVTAIALLAIAAAPGLAQDATPAASEPFPAPVRTNTRLISPFTPDGLNPALTAIATEDGSCDSLAAATIGRPDAWGCFSASDQPFDPCFENPFVADDTGQVACFASPFSTEITLLNLTDPLPRAKGDNGELGAAPGNDDLAPWDLPWALDLANGERCDLMGGTLTVIAGQVAYYGCSGGGSVVGMTDRTQPLWTVSYLAKDDYATTLVAVITAWS